MDVETFANFEFFTTITKVLEDYHKNPCFSAATPAAPPIEWQTWELISMQVCDGEVYWFWRRPRELGYKRDRCRSTLVSRLSGLTLKDIAACLNSSHDSSDVERIVNEVMKDRGVHPSTGHYLLSETELATLVQQILCPDTDYDPAIVVRFSEGGWIKVNTNTRLKHFS